MYGHGDDGLAKQATVYDRCGWLERALKDMVDLFLAYDDAVLKDSKDCERAAYNLLLGAAGYYNQQLAANASIGEIIATTLRNRQAQ